MTCRNEITSQLVRTISPCDSWLYAYKLYESKQQPSRVSEGAFNNPSHQPTRAYQTPNVSDLEPFHQVPPHGPHPGSFAVYVHGYGCQQASQLNGADDLEDAFRAVGLEPVVEEEGEN